MNRIATHIRPTYRPGLAAALALTTCCTGRLLADVTTIDFDAFANNTVITTQYSGVTFSTAGNSCGGAPVINAIIVTPAGGASSGTKALSLQTGCPDFSPDRLVASFDDPHAEITFSLGAFPGNYEVKAYNVANGGIAVVTQNIAIGGAGAAGVHRFVRVERPVDKDIRRVEIRETSGSFEYIDDLTYDCIDTTVPTAAITSPAALACVCNSSVVQGTANDADGDLLNWRLERKAPDAANWTLIALSSTPVNNGNLATWTTTASTGYYILRLTVTNKCGLTNTATTVVWLDKSFDASPVVRGPAANAIVGGNVCIDGSVGDHCGGTMNVEYRALPTGAFAPVQTIYPPWITTDPLGVWNSAGKPDGNYEIRVTASDSCGNVATPVVVPVTLDNTAPTAFISSPAGCAHVGFGIVPVFGTANDAHLATWSLSYSGGDIHTWVNIANGAAPVNNNVLGLWSTLDLPRCAYVLRLRVTDTAAVDCNAPHVSEYYTTVDLASCCDLNGDGSGDGLDVQPFVNCLLNDICP